MTMHLVLCFVSIISTQVGLALTMGEEHRYALIAYLSSIVACGSAVALVL
jgi:hypothetical protein